MSLNLSIWTAKAKGKLMTMNTEFHLNLIKYRVKHTWTKSKAKQSYAVIISCLFWNTVVFIFSGGQPLSSYSLFNDYVLYKDRWAQLAASITFVRNLSSLRPVTTTLSDFSQHLSWVILWPKFFFLLGSVYYYHDNRLLLDLEAHCKCWILKQNINNIEKFLIVFPSSKHTLCNDV